MTLADAPAGWYVLMKAADIKRGKIFRRWLFDTPVIVFRSGDKLHVMLDQCPHRGAPLSEGRIVGGEVECPYHGWRFKPEGDLSAIPCLAAEMPNARARVFETQTEFGLLFVKIGAVEDGPYVNPLRSSVKFWCPIYANVRAGLADAAENFLDPTHTVFVHHQLIRSVKNTNPTRVEVRGASDRAEIHYYGEGKVSSVISSLMREKDRALSIGRFVRPNVSEVEFYGPQSVSFIMTGYMTPTRGDLTEGFGVVGIPGPRWWAAIKFAVLYPWLRIIHWQDRKVLENTKRNNDETGRTTHMIGPLDVMRPQIDALLKDKLPPAAKAPRELTMNL